MSRSKWRSSENTKFISPAQRGWTLKCVRKRQGREGEGEGKERESHRKWHTSEDSKFIFSRLQSTTNVWSSINRMGPLKEFPHGDTFALTLSSRSLNTTLSCVCLCVCGCIFVYVCLSGLKKAYASKGSELSEKGKFVLDRRLYAHTHT